jgi:endonuclease/exonuclease/phosphatase family metal-dependent hydrolase
VVQRRRVAEDIEVADTATMQWRARIESEKKSCSHRPTDGAVLGQDDVVTRLRLATANILHGRSISDGLVDDTRMGAAIASLGADVIALQEVDAFQPRSNSVDQAAVVAAAAGTPHWRFMPAITGEPGGSWTASTASDTSGSGLVAPDTARYGTALLSRRPVERWHRIELAAAPVRSPVYIPSVKRWILLRDEPRVAIAAELRLDGGPGIVVAGVHLSFVPGWNVVQLRRLTRALSDIAAGRPVVLMGDCNLPSPLPRVASRWTPLTPPIRTFPSPNPRLAIDHVLIHRRVAHLVTPTDALAHHLPISDHRTITVDVDVQS